MFQNTDDALELFQKKNDKIQCLLCPNSCLLENGQLGQCLARKAIDDKIVPSGYHHISSISIDPIEKKPFKHFLPGTKTFSVGGYGGSLKCVFC